MYSQFVNTGSSKSADARLGLCADCVHARKVESSRGSAFLLCRLSLTDPRFPKYPPLPVLQCAGFKRIAMDV